jgi:hypothetical protein
MWKNRAMACFNGLFRCYLHGVRPPEYKAGLLNPQLHHFVLLLVLFTGEYRVLK